MQQRISYLVSITKSADSDYAATFHDFPGCITAGHDLKELYEMVEEALALHIYGVVSEGGLLPAPSSLRAVSDALEEQLKDTETEVVGFTYVHCLVTTDLANNKKVEGFFRVQKDLILGPARTVSEAYSEKMRKRIDGIVKKFNES